MVIEEKICAARFFQKAGGASHNKPEKLFGAKSNDGIFFAGKPRRDKPGDKR